MIPVDQTKFPSETENGNCFAAAVASLLELPLDQVPQFEDYMDKDWWPKMTRWFESMGFDLFVRRHEMWLPGYYLVMGKSPRGNFNHQVVFKAGEMVHDPHPSRDGILDIQEVIALIPLDPARYCRMKDQ